MSSATSSGSTSSGSESSPVSVSPRSYALGRFTLRLEHRGFGGDGGTALRVYGPGRGGEQELLRFDCFDKRPHYHVGLAHPGARIVAIDEPEAFEWSVAHLRSRLTELLLSVGAEPPSADELALFQGALDDARATGLSWRG